MTFNAPSFFAGIGTMLALIVLGFGGGVLMSDVMFDHRSRTLTKTDRQASEQSRPPIPTNPVPVVEAKSAPVSLPVAQPMSAPAPMAEPQPLAPISTQPEPRTMLAAPVTGVAPTLGPQQAVSLTNQAPQDKAGRNEARQKRDKAKRAALGRKKADERRFAAEGRQQQFREAEVKAVTERPRAIDVEDDEPDERPLLRPERDDSFRAPRIRRLGNDW